MTASPLRWAFAPPAAPAPAPVELTAPAVALAEGPPANSKLVYDMHLRMKLCKELEQLYPTLGFGYSRQVFDGGHVVYKVGLHAIQLHELAAFEQPETYDHLPVAPCRLVWHESGIAILIMETVRPAAADDELPEWASLIDDHQVGWRADGSCVIFDAGEPLYTRPTPRHFVQSHAVPAVFS